MAEIRRLLQRGGHDWIKIECWERFSSMAVSVLCYKWCNMLWNPVFYAFYIQPALFKVPPHKGCRERDVYRTFQQNIPRFTPTIPLAFVFQNAVARSDVSGRTLRSQLTFFFFELKRMRVRNGGLGRKKKFWQYWEEWCFFRSVWKRAVKYKCE